MRVCSWLRVPCNGCAIHHVSSVPRNPRPCIIPGRMSEFRTGRQVPLVPHHSLFLSRQIAPHPPQIGMAYSSAGSGAYAWRTEVAASCMYTHAVCIHTAMAWHWHADPLPVAHQLLQVHRCSE